MLGVKERGKVVENWKLHDENEYVMNHCWAWHKDFTFLKVFLKKILLSGWTEMSKKKLQMIWLKTYWKTANERAVIMKTMSIRIKRRISIFSAWVRLEKLLNTFWAARRGYTRNSDDTNTIAAKKRLSYATNQKPPRTFPNEQFHSSFL